MSIDQNEADAIKEERGDVYGDPYLNHKLLGGMMTGVLQSHHNTLRLGNPLPAHAASNVLACLKLNRTRLKHHPDNFVDGHNYFCEFTNRFQKLDEADVTVAQPHDGPTLVGTLHNEDWRSRTAMLPGIHRIYVAGPFTKDPEECTRRAKNIGLSLAAKGHLVHVPHAATGFMDGRGYNRHYFMSIDLSLIECWATALYVFGEGETSVGRDEEVRLAEKMGIPIFRRIEDVPTYPHREAWRESRVPSSFTPRTEDVAFGWEG